MKYKIRLDAFGVADVTLTDRERDVVRSRRVPMIYAPGGMGPGPLENGNCMTFGGACFVNVEQKLLSCLAQFRAALAAEIERQHKARLAAAAWNVGFDDFPAGGWADAMRGTKSYPEEPRCPFRMPERVTAWTAGYNAAALAIVTGETTA